VKTVGDPNTLLMSVRRAVWAVDRNVALVTDGSLENDMQSRLYAEPKFGVVLLGSFGGLGLALVAIGIFSVMAHSVSLQTHDIGVRMALGAEQDRVLRMVLGKGLALIFIGIAVGEAASAVLTRVAASEIWGVSATDPITFGGVVVVVAVVGTAACLLPARRATRVDPMVALRYE
jgi:putative ABC transport system permease protein